jgi:hypothetical protein
MFNKVTENVVVKGIDLPLKIATEISSILITDGDWKITYINRHAGAGNVVINEGVTTIQNSMPQWAALTPIMKLVEKAFLALLPSMLQKLNPPEAVTTSPEAVTPSTN